MSSTNNIPKFYVRETPKLSSKIWEKTTKTRYIEMLCVLPPINWSGTSFLVGEPYCDRICAVSKKYATAFSAFLQRNKKYYQTKGPVTKAEFQELLKKYPPETRETIIKEFPKKTRKSISV